MISYSLSSDPNQTFEVSPEGTTYVFTIKRIRGFMYVIIEGIGQNRIAGPLRVCNAAWLIPHAAYNYATSGNFIIVNRNGQYPDFENFSQDCELRYFTKAEIDSLPIE